MITYLWIALGGALGSMGRYGVSRVFSFWVGETFPWGTLAVNIIGSFVIGMFAVLSGPDGRMMVAPDARQFVMVGICGGFTTFSSFSLQTLELLRAGALGRALANIALSVILCLCSVALGYVAADRLNGHPHRIAEIAIEEEAS